MHEFTVIFVFNVDDSPFVGACTNHFAVDVDGLFGTDDCKGNSSLMGLEVENGRGKYLHLSIESTLFVIELIVVIRVHFEIVKSKFSFDL